MKIVFFGTPEIAVPSLQTLSIAPYITIEAVVTQPDRKVGRKQILTPPAVKVAAERMDLKVLQPENAQELLEDLEEINADYYVVFAYGMIFPTEILELPAKAAINIHTSTLPKYRGASPIQEALLNGDQETGITIIQMSEKMDAGDVYLVKKVDIAPEENLTSLTNKLAKVASEIIPIALEDIDSGLLSPIPQEHEKATYCRKIKKTDGEINWQKSTSEILNMIKAYTPWPSTYTNFHGKKLKILAAEPGKEQIEPGKFQLINSDQLKIGTADGSIKITEVQMEGKSPTEVGNFINGYRQQLDQGSST